MKIKFIKDYVSVDPATNSGIIHRFGETEEIKEYTAQWLIDNGFAEEVKEREFPQYGDAYYFPRASFLSERFEPTPDEYCDTVHDRIHRQIGLCYKTEKACQRFIDFLTAVETVRHDEGFMKYNKICCEVWELRRVYLDVDGRFTAHKVESEFLHDLGAFYFDTEEHAKASIKKHPKEWQTIMNYDWSKGEKEEDEN